MKPVRGRCLKITKDELTLQNEAGVSHYKIKTLPNVSVGDIVEIQSDQVRVLTKNTGLNSKMSERILNPRRLKAMRTRSLVEAGVRDFFVKQNFHEVRTPLLVRSAGMEAHIDPFQLSTGQYLPSSPELSMKKLLVGGLEKIFQICSAFRNEPFSEHHRPEFTMLEFYRAYSDHEKIQEDVEKLIESLAIQILNTKKIKFQNQEIDLVVPWPRLQINDLFKQHLDIDLVKENTVQKLKSRAGEINVLTSHDDTWDEVYFRLWIEKIEPRLPKERAVFVTHYPASQAALANIDENGCAKRFEAYIGGIELCNGFDELTDAVEQKKRFLSELDYRKTLTKDKDLPLGNLDSEFIDALTEGMPPSGGVAVGLDRLIMLLADEPDIEYCFWLNPS